MGGAFAQLGNSAAANGTALFVMQKFTTRKGIAERYHISLGSVKALMRRRILPYVKIGRIVRFELEKCDATMRGSNCTA